MKEVGYVRTTSRSGFLVIKARSALRKGTPLFDSRGRMLGIAQRTFGPVEAPYVTARPEEEPEIGILGEKVYVKGDKNGKKKERTRNKR